MSLNCDGITVTSSFAHFLKITVLEFGVCVFVKGQGAHHVRCHCPPRARLNSTAGKLVQDFCRSLHGEKNCLFIY